MYSEDFSIDTSKAKIGTILKESRSIREIGYEERINVCYTHICTFLASISLGLETPRSA